MVFFGVVGLIALGCSIPLMAMYGAEIYVGQTPSSEAVKFAVKAIVGLGLFAGVAESVAYAFKGGVSVTEWILLALVAGSAVTGHISVQELVDGSRTASLSPSTSVPPLPSKEDEKGERLL